MTTEEQYPELPEPFLSRMERLLGEEYQAFSAVTAMKEPRDCV